jgi:hypothetical protein
MRTYALLGITLALAIAGCTSSRHAASASKTALSPLAPCESREVSLDGADAVVTSNADSTLASVRFVDGAGNAARRAALAAMYRVFGTVHVDTDLVAQSSKWGLATWTDRCGRPVTFTIPQRTPAVH